MKRQSKRKPYGGRILSSLLALCLLIGMLPMAALAEEGDMPDGGTPIVCAELEGCTDEAHDEECPLYEAPVETDDEDTNDYYETDKVPDEDSPTAAEQLQARIDAIPSAEMLDGLNVKEQADIYAEICSIYDAIDELNNMETDVLNLAALVEAMKFFNQQVMQLEEATTANYDWYNDSETTYKINTVSDLLGFAHIVNASATLPTGITSTDFSGKTIVLDNDLDLSNITWIPVGNANHKFSGTFDGNNHTISDLKIDDVNGIYQGLFGYCVSATIKNTKIVNADITCNYRGGIVAGLAENCSFDSIEISDSSIAGKGHIGGLVGRVQTTASAEENRTIVQRCSIKSTSVAALSMASSWDDTVDNNDNNNKVDGVTPFNTRCGGITSITVNAPLDVIECTLEDVDLKGWGYTCGIVGLAYGNTATTSITGTEFSGTVYSKTGGATAGLAAATNGAVLSTNDCTVDAVLSGNKDHEMYPEYPFTTSGTVKNSSADVVFTKQGTIFPDNAEDCTVTAKFVADESGQKFGGYTWYSSSDSTYKNCVVTVTVPSAISEAVLSASNRRSSDTSHQNNPTYEGCTLLIKTEETLNSLSVKTGVGGSSPLYVDFDTAVSSVTIEPSGRDSSPDANVIAVLNGGTFPKGTTFTSGTLATPTREGYTFGGWYANSESTGTAVTAPTAGQTYYAKWVERGGVSGLGTEESPYVLKDGAHIYALARILAKQPANDRDTILTDELKADYLLFGYLSSYKAAYTAIQSAYYELGADITLSNCDAEGNYNGFCGIPNFYGGSFDGKDHIITLNMDFSQYPAEAKSIGGVFANAKDAVIKNLKLSGSATGTLASTETLKDVGLLIGATSNGTQPTTLENISSSAAIDMTVNLGISQCAYIAAMVGRGYSVTMKNCVNKGDFTAASDNPTTNAPRVAGLVGHAYTGFQLENCANEGTIQTTGSGPLTAGDLLGTGSPSVYKNCVSSGSVSSQAGTLSVFSGMRTDCAKADGNVIRVTVTGKAGDRIVNTDAGIDHTYSEDGDQVFDLPVYYTEDGVRNYSKYMQEEYLAVNRDSRLFLFDLRNTTFTTTLNTADAVTEALPFGSWATALPISTTEHLLWMQQAINDGEETAIKALYALGGKSGENLDLETARIVLRSAYYKLQNDVTVTGENGFTGIGDADFFGGHFDGGGHTLTLTITKSVSDLTENIYFGLFGRMVPLTDGVVEVRNLNVVSSFDLTLPMDTSYSAYVGGLAGYANDVTLNNVNVTLQKLNLAKNGTQGAGAQGGVNAGGCFGTELTWKGNAPTVKINCTITADWPVAETDKKVGSLNAGGFAGHGQYGGSVEFIGGDGIDAKNIPAPKIGGVMGYSWSSNILDGLSVKNSTGHAITLGGATAQVGILIGYHTTSSAAADAVSLSADGVSVEGAFVLKGRHVGGLFGYADTSGIINIANCALSDEIDVPYTVNNGYYGGLIGYVYMRGAPLRLRGTAVGVKVPGGNGNNTGALIGYMTKASSIEAQNSAYVIRNGEVAIGQKQASPTAPVPTIDGAAVLDSTVLTGTKSYGDTVQLHTNIPMSTALTIAPADAFTLSDGTVAFTKVGSAQKAALKWNDKTFYTSGEITVNPKALTGRDVIITGVNSVYASDDAAKTALESIAVVYGDKALAKDTDYTVEQSTSGDHKFTITFAGNFSGTAEVAYTVSDAALVASAQGYTGVYDAAEHAITVTAPEGATITYGAGSESLSEANPSYTDAGTHVVYWKAAMDGNEVTGSAVVIITPAPLTIKADDKAVYVGDALPTTYTYNVSGWQGGDKDTVTLTGVSASCPNADAAMAGTYTIIVTGPASIDNYTITYEPGTLTVSSRSGGSGSSSTSGVSGSGGSVSISAGSGTVSNSQMTAAVNKASEGATIDIKAAGSTAVSLPVSGMEKAAANDNDVAVITRSGEITLSAAAIEGLVDGASSSQSIRVSVTTAAASAAGVDAGTPVFEVSVSVGGKMVHSFDGPLTITLTVSNLSRIENPYVLHILTNGTKEYLKPTVSGNQLTVSGVRGLHYFAVIPGSDVPQGLPFTDVAEDFWAYDAISYAYEKGLFAGTSTTTFTPNATMTREMLWTVLGRLSGAELTGSGVFERARQWAVSNGVSDGANGGNTITREQMVTMLYRYAGSPAVSGDLSVYTDACSVSGYAADAMAWAASSGIISGTAAATLSPQGSATRAQVAMILMRFIEHTDQ